MLALALVLKEDHRVGQRVVIMPRNKVEVGGGLIRAIGHDVVDALLLCVRALGLLDDEVAKGLLLQVGEVLLPARDDEDDRATRRIVGALEEPRSWLVQSRLLLLPLPAHARRGTSAAAQAAREYVTQPCGGVDARRHKRYRVRAGTSSTAPFSPRPPIQLVATYAR